MKQPIFVFTIFSRGCEYLFHKFYRPGESAMTKKTTFIYALVAFVAVVLLFFAIVVFPLAGGDSIVFLTPALFYAKSGGFINPLYYVTKLTNDARVNLFNYYVPLFPWLLGFFSKIYPGIKTLFLWCATFGIASLCLYSRELKKKLSNNSVFFLIIAYLSITYLAAYLIPTFGRPEILSSFIVTCLYLLYQRKSSLTPLVYDTVLTLCFALLLSTQILGFWFAYLIFLAEEFFSSQSTGKIILQNTLRLITILSIFILILSLSPAGLMPTLTGIQKHISLVLLRHEHSFYLYCYYWFLSFLNFGFIIIFLLSGWYYLKVNLVRLKILSKSRVIIIIVLYLVLIISLFKFVLYSAPTVYNVTQFIIPILLFLLQRLSSEKKIALCHYITLVVFAYGSLIFLRMVVLSIDYSRDGRDFDQASVQLDQQISRFDSVKISPGLWSLCNDVKKIRPIYDFDFKPGEMVVVQNGDESERYLPLSRWEKIFDDRIPGGKIFLGLPVRHPQGYTFAIYRVK